MERQYIFFRTGRALLVFTAGVLVTVAGVEALMFLAPGDSGLLVFLVASMLTLFVVVASIKVDARIWRKPRN
jgi:hypothetical protein